MVTFIEQPEVIGGHLEAVWRLFGGRLVAVWWRVVAFGGVANSPIKSCSNSVQAFELIRP